MNATQELLKLSQEFSSRPEHTVFTTVLHHGNTVTAYLDILDVETEENLGQHKFTLELNDAMLIHSEEWFDEHHDK